MSRTYPCHMMRRAEGITHFENLANLDRVVGRLFTFIGSRCASAPAPGHRSGAVAVLR
jgi:kynurenine formamidase